MTTSPTRIATAAARSLVSTAAEIVALRAAAVVVPSVRLPGIDVSHWQGEIEWARVAYAGVCFAIVKASQGAGVTEARGYTANRRGARAAGITVGAYHFCDPTDSPRDNVRHLVSVVGPAQADELPAALDLERAGGLKPAALLAWLKEALERTAGETGRRPLLYTSARVLWDLLAGGRTATAKARLAGLDDSADLWIKRYWSRPDPGPIAPWSEWALWQYTGSGSVPGIAGHVDRNWAAPDALARLCRPLVIHGS